MNQRLPKVEEGVSSSHAHRRRGVSPDPKQQRCATQGLSIQATPKPQSRTEEQLFSGLNPPLEGKSFSNYTPKQKVCFLRLFIMPHPNAIP